MQDKAAPKSIDEMPMAIQDGIAQFREQALVALMRRLLRAKGRSTGEIYIPIDEIEMLSGANVTFDIDGDRKRFVLRLER
jgi:hypothetical protein